MFKKSIEALKAAEVALKEDLDALFVPYDPATGSGGVHWHAAGSGILTEALGGVAGVRANLEKRQENQDKANAEAEAAVAAAAPPQPIAETTTVDEPSEAEVPA